MATRIITGVLGIAIAAGIITAGGWLFVGAVVLLALIGWHEFSKMAAAGGYQVYLCTSGLPVLLLTGVTGFYYVLFADFGGLEFIFLSLMLLSVGFFLLAALEGLVRHCRSGAEWLTNTLLSSWGMLYCGLLFAHVIIVRAFCAGKQIAVGPWQMDYGEALLWAVLLSTWASDTCAYIFGRAFGRHPFCSVSPKKTMEGAAAGFIGSLLVACLCLHNILLLPLWQAVLTGAAIAFCAPLGDLVESVLKRTFAIKDSGNLFPGHGGVLDRFDSLLFAAPAAYYTLTFLLVFFSI